MKAILKSFDQYFVRVNSDNSWDEVYDPNVATIFSSKKKAREWAEENTTLSEHMETESNIERIKKDHAEWVNNGMIRRSFDPLPVNMNQMFDPEKHDAMDIFNWFYEFNSNPEYDMLIKQEVYSSWSDARYSENYFEFIDEVQSFYNHDDFSKRYISFRIKVYPNSKFEDFKKEMDVILENFNFNLVDDNGSLMIDIFDHDLSATRSPVLFMIDYENDKWALADVRFKFGDEYDIGPTSLEECFNYIRKNWYYDV